MGKDSPQSPEFGEPQDIEKIVDAILFDWDGVLYDGTHNIGLSALETCREFGVEVSMEYYVENYTQPWWKFYERLGIPAATEEERRAIHDTYARIHANRRHLSEVYPEVAETLRALATRRVHLGIVSAGKLDNIKLKLAEKGLLELFDEQHLVGEAHQKAEAIKAFCEKNALSPERVLMVGDLPSDLEDGRAAGVKVAAVARFESAVTRLSSYKPDFLLTDMGSSILKPAPFKSHKE